LSLKGKMLSYIIKAILWVIHDSTYIVLLLYLMFLGRQGYRNLAYISILKTLFCLEHLSEAAVRPLLFPTLLPGVVEEFGG